MNVNTYLASITVRRIQQLSLSAVLACSVACSSKSEQQDNGLEGVYPDAAVAKPIDANTQQPVSTTPVTHAAADSGVAVVIEVPADAAVCSADLPFKAPGCACDPGATAGCWTGPAERRLMGKCRDGVQKCVAAGEFGMWGPCEGQVLDCGAPPPPPKEECGCVPGTVVGCDEDCTALVFCAPFSTKVCQPDGKFGPCRETLLPTGEHTNVCLNVFHGCLPDNPEGVFVGDCDGAFTCGHPPGAPPTVN